MSTVQDVSTSAQSVALDRDVFLRSLIRELSGVLQRTVGLEDAEGYISVVGQRIGDWIDQEYRSALHTDRLDRDQVAAVLVDLKSRIGGGFSLVSADDSRLVYDNHTCPFEDKVEGRPSMCMMTSNVFGAIASANLGYAKVELASTIALGAERCSVVVHLDEDAAADVAGREYFAD